MGKYNMSICKCGRIHMIDSEKLNTALHNNKNLMIICGGCGTVKLSGADVFPDWEDPEKDCYMLYEKVFSPYDDTHITVVDFESGEDSKGIEEIIYSHGVKVPMRTGMYATDYCNGRFSDRWYPDFYKIQRKDVTVDEIMKFINDYTVNRTTVDMERFIRENNSDVLEEISHYHIEGFNWKGTRFETEYNSK